MIKFNLGHGIMVVVDMEIQSWAFTPCPLITWPCGFIGGEGSVTKLGHISHW
jgi:hypothetical protein